MNAILLQLLMTLQKEVVALEAQLAAMQSSTIAVVSSTPIGFVPWVPTSTPDFYGRQDEAPAPAGSSPWEPDSSAPVRQNGNGANLSLGAAEPTGTPLVEVPTSQLVGSSYISWLDSSTVQIELSCSQGAGNPATEADITLNGVNYPLASSTYWEQNIDASSSGIIAGDWYHYSLHCENATEYAEQPDELIQL